MSAVTGLSGQYALLARPVEMFDPYLGRCCYIRNGDQYVPLCAPNVSYPRSELDFTDTHRICRACKEIATTMIPFTKLEVAPDE